MATLLGAASGRAGAGVSAGAANGPAVIGQPRPALELDAIDGSVVNDVRMAGRPMIVAFHATWCQPCHRALADLLANLDQARQPAGPPAIQLVLVDLGEAPDVVKRWAATTKLPADAIVALDPNRSAARLWGAGRVPTTFIVDARGVVRHINRGWGAGYRDRVLRWLRTMNVPGAPAP